MARSRPHAALCLLLLAGCAREGRERITLGVVPIPSLGLVFIAEASGYFAARGVSVEQRRFPTGRDALAALAAGEVDAVTAYTTPVAVRAAKDDLEAVTTLHASTRLTRLVARADRGIARAEDLAGKRIAVPVGTSGEVFLHALLAYAGVEGAVTVVNRSPADAIRALLAGEVDAAVTWPPFVYAARPLVERGQAVELPSDVYVEISMLVVNGATHRARHGALVRLVRALADAERLVREEPEQAFRALRAAFPDVGEQELRDAWGATRPVLGLTHELAAVLEREAAWLRARGHADGPPLDVDAVLDPDVLGEVDPEAITFVSPAHGDAAR
jgi:NitT/TauT family transport system substrate-binding protein